MAEIEGMGRHEDRVSTKQSQAGPRRDRTAYQTSLVRPHRKAISASRDCPDKPCRTRLRSPRSRTSLPGLELVILVVAILLIAIALPLHAGFFSDDGYDAPSSTPSPTAL